MTATIPKLAYGLRDAVPDTAIAAWGARAIISADGYVDIVGDRTDLVGDGARLLKALEAFPPKALRDTVRAKILASEILTREAADVTLFADGPLTVVANSNASAGYLYIAAYLEDA
jgi:hypothetical protein